MRLRDAIATLSYSNNGSSRSTGTVILLRLAGVNPNSDAKRIMISA